MPSSRRYRELAVLLPVAGLVLFMPPYLLILSRPEELFGIPVLQIYIFAVWLGGIAVTAALSRRLVRDLTGEEDARREADKPPSGQP